MDLNQVTKAYLNIRDARSKAKAEWEAGDDALKASQEKLEGVMLSYLEKHNVDRMGTDLGTFYRQADIKPSAGDWNAVYAWIKEHDAWELLERRLKKTFVSDFMETHDGMLPPGVNVHREYVVRVRRAQ